MTEQREESLRKAISYCIENFDVNKATSRLIEFIKDEEAINYSQCCAELKAVDITEVEDIPDPYWKEYIKGKQ